MLDCKVLQENGVYDGLAAIAQYACSPVEPGKGTPRSRENKRYAECYAAVRRMIPGASYEDTSMVLERLLVDSHLDVIGYIDLRAINETEKSSRGIAWLVCGWGLGKYLLHRKKWSEAFGYAFEEYRWLNYASALGARLLAMLQQRTSQHFQHCIRGQIRHLMNWLPKQEK